MHKGYKSAIYLMQGRVETRYGEGLKKSVVNVAGDFIFIPPDVPHQPFNLSDTEPAIAIVDAQRSGRAGARRGLSKGQKGLTPAQRWRHLTGPARLPKSKNRGFFPLVNCVD